MTLKNIFYATILTFCLISCSTTSQKDDVAQSQQQITNNIPKVDVEIRINDTIANYGDKIMLSIKLTNKENEVQKILFDKPTGKPWATTINIINHETKELVKCKNIGNLSSQIYLKEQLKEHYYYLKPEQTINGQYELADIVLLDFPDNLLQKGRYEIQLFYYENPSNIVTCTIR